MGSLNQQAGGSGSLGQVDSMLSESSEVPKSQMNGFASLLDMNGDGNVVDDVLNFASKFLK